MEEDLKQYPSLELRTVAGMGRGVFTKVPISAGATIFSALPIAHCSVEKTRGTICEHCFNRSESLKKCTECESVQYCNSDCQKFDLPLHEAECDSVRGVGAPPLVRLALRALTKNTKHLCSLPDGWFTRDDQNDKNQLIADTARLCDYPKCLIRQLFLKLFCNSFIVMSANGMSDVGVAVYSAPSLLNHSCRPNTFALFNGPRLLIKALRDISRGEQLFFPYTKTLQLKSERQTDLQKGYNFTCACERCSEDLPGFSDYDRDLLMGANGKEVPRLLRQEMEKELAELIELNERGEWQKVYDKGRALYTKYSAQLSPDNFLSIRLMEHLAIASTSTNLSLRKEVLREEALKYVTQLLGPYLRHYGILEPTSIFWLLKTGRLRRCLGTTEQLIESLDNLTKARTAAETLYGADHPFTREAAIMLTYTQREIARRQQ